MVKGQKVLLSILAVTLISLLPLEADYEEPLVHPNLSKNMDKRTSITNSDFTLQNTILPQNFQLFQFSNRENNNNLKLDLLLKTSEFNPVAYQYIEKKIRFENGIGHSFFTASLITLSALNLADYFSTREALKSEGFKEANPLMKPFVKNPVVFGTVKLGLSAFNYYSLKKIYKKDKKLAWVVSTISNFIVSYAVWNNIKLIKSSHRR
jgi:hypothetical protein